ncbi:hypothetical protein RRG08_046334 [Elysia crispata]|uniref:Uncharacterized protein n=1 Tax=Elysia crispata TaxID=231223 RepID=A0AAE1A4N9_9GAST|nr:hypothetical protein RRG08_046334 [Elysia crispata]
MLVFGNCIYDSKMERRVKFQSSIRFCQSVHLDNLLRDIFNYRHNRYNNLQADFRSNDRPHSHLNLALFRMTSLCEPPFLLKAQKSGLKYTGTKENVKDNSKKHLK